MNKLLIITVVFLCLIYTISGYTAGEAYKVTNISTCYGQVQVKVRSSIGIVDGEYSIVNCTGEDNLWTCECNDDNSIQILTDVNTTNVYDITVEYYLAPLTDDNITNEDNERTLQFPNIGFKNVEKEEPFKLPKFENGKMILIVIGSILLFIGLIAFLLWKYVLKEEGDMNDRQMDREIDEYTRKYTR